MTITAGVQRQFFGDDLPIVPSRIHGKQVIRLPPATASASSTTAASTSASPRKGSLWTDEEHERFLTGLEMYPRGPWKLIAQVVATRTTRQTMTHAQKYRQRIARHSRQSTASVDTLPSDPTPLSTAPGEATERQPSRQKMNDPGDGMRTSLSIARKRTRKKRTAALALEAEPGHEHEQDPPQLPPELVAMEWLLAVHPVDWESEVKRNASFDNVLLV